MTWLGDTLGSLFGASPSASTNPLERIYGAPGSAASMAYGGAAAPYGGGGLLDPRGIREQALWSGLGALSAGLIAAGQRRPAMQPSLLPQALGAFQPAYAGALQSGYQQAALEQQFADREARERQIAALPATEQQLYRTLGPEGYARYVTQRNAPYNLGPDERRMVGNQVIATAPSRPPQPHPPQVMRNADGTYTVIDPDAVRAGGTPPGTAPAAPPGTAPSPAPAAAPPGGPVETARGQLRASESGGNPAAVGPEIRGPGTGSPRAGGIYQFMPDTWAGVARAHPELRLTPEGIYNEEQQDRAFTAHANDILRQTQDLVGRQVNGVTITPDALIRGAFMGGITGVRRYVESGGRYNPRDINGRSVDDYVRGNLPGTQRGGGAATAPGAAPTSAAAPPTAATPPAAPGTGRRQIAPGITEIGSPRPTPSFPGNSLEATAWNIVNDPNRDTSSRDYAAAYSILRMPHPMQVQDPNNAAALITVLVPRELPAHVVPPGTPPSAATAPPAAAAPPAAGAPAPAAAPGSAAPPAAPAPQPAPAPSPVAGTSVVSPQAREAVRRAELDGTRILDAATNFERVASRSDAATRLNTWLRNPMSPAAAELQQAYENLIIAVRGESFANTGVLQPNEMLMLANQFRDPATLRGALASDEVRRVQLAQLRGMVQSVINRQRASIGQPPIEFPDTPSAAAPRVVDYDSQGRPVARPQ